MLSDEPRDYAGFGERLGADIVDGVIGDADNQAWHDKVFRTYVVSD